MVLDDLIPELELDIIPAEDGELQVELMHKEFFKYLKENEILDLDINFITSRELKGFVENLYEKYKLYKVNN